MKVYVALMQSLEGRQPLSGTAIDYLVARGYEVDDIRAAIRRGLDRGEIKLGRQFELIKA